MAPVQYDDTSALWWHQCSVMTPVHYDDTSALWWHQCSVMTPVHYDGTSAVWWHQCNNSATFNDFSLIVMPSNSACLTAVAIVWLISVVDVDIWMSHMAPHAAPFALPSEFCTLFQKTPCSRFVHATVCVFSRDGNLLGFNKKSVRCLDRQGARWVASFEVFMGVIEDVSVWDITLRRWVPSKLRDHLTKITDSRLSRQSSPVYFDIQRTVHHDIFL
jgi:hypothetical protein